MNKTYTPKRFRFEENTELRAANKSVVERWFQADLATKEGAAKMHELFAEFGRKELRYRLEGTQELNGSELLDHHRELSGSVASWVWEDLKITGTQFPAVFWAFSSGRGMLDGSEEEYFNRFVHLFVVEKGKIRLLREWVDPALDLARSGKTVPYL
ncbi:PhzA/PhzB family protein [Homoserinimonas sp. OAct 916]|uniref:PhzA/PhzB family protein n=1 Tax=Homoserinimonas sp. OAct 916 TaxID=2211450 RepID=UPI000DBE636D|nr:PhzA/PhzB family protein [Homoserinimonas sp. OAct 916]